MQTQHLRVTEAEYEIDRLKEIIVEHEEVLEFKKREMAESEAKYKVKLEQVEDISSTISVDYEHKLAKANKRGWLAVALQKHFQAILMRDFEEAK